MRFFSFGEEISKEEYERRMEIIRRSRVSEEIPKEEALRRNIQLENFVNSFKKSVISGAEAKEELKNIRQFSTGATRSPLGDKLQYEGYLNPLVLKRYAEYMKKHQTASDGSQREPDNWQKGIDMDSLHDSKLRHDTDAWLHHRGYPEEATEDYEESLCASLFNTMGILLQVLEKNGRGIKK